MVIDDLLRVASDRAGTDLWPTAAEARAAAEDRANAAEARVRELEAMMAKLAKRDSEE